MSETETDDAQDDVGQGHNSGPDQAKLIQNCATEFARIKLKRGELNKQAGDIRKRLSDSGVQPKVFEYALRIAEMEIDAQVEHTEQLELCFDALKVGQGVSATQVAQDALDDMASAGNA
jgi:hypothetical protein